MPTPEGQERKAKRKDKKSAKKSHKPEDATAIAETSADAGNVEDVKEPVVSKEKQSKKKEATFKSLGLNQELCEACDAVGWKAPTEIQRETVPLGIQGKDLIALAQTGSGKTGAFALPILQKLMDNPSQLFALVVSPTRELAMQIVESFDGLGSSIGLRTCAVTGGIDEMTQMRMLAKKPHVIVATPGRIVFHLENMKGFNLRTIKFLVLDEADRLLHEDFEKEIDVLLQALPRERQTFLFSATMTNKVAKLQRASLVNPVKVEVASKYSTVDTLKQEYIFMPFMHKDVYLAYLLNELAGSSAIVFCCTCAHAQRLAIFLRSLGFGAIPIHGKLTQNKRLGALNKFKSGQREILIATDVASRGLDIPSVDVVVNYEIPRNSKDYVHRVGRTARAGRTGRAVTFVSQYDVELYQRIEALIGKKLPAFPAEQDSVMLLMERVQEAQRIAAREMRDSDFGKKDSGGAGDDEDDMSAILTKRKRLQKGGKPKPHFKKHKR